MIVLVAVLAAAIGLLAGVLLTRGRHSGQPDDQPQDQGQPGAFPRLLPAAGAVLEALPVAVLVVDVADEVLLGNRAARELGVIRDGVLAAFPELRRLVRQTRRTATAHEVDLVVPMARLARPPAVFRARVAPIGDGTTAILLEDVSEARRLEDVRRDFVANVSHELKTPVGALSLLAEALQDASDDPAAVRRFASRAQLEAVRLGRLVQELLDLSRLQGADPMPAPTDVEIDRVIAEAVDRTRMPAQSRGIALTVSGDTGLRLLGNEEQLVTAVVNLLDNAVSYSGEGSEVTLRTAAVDDAVEISVVDEGIGIPEKDLERVFERFYRADPARSRATGGTGLGLAIVKHVATNHGGTVQVHSVERLGATFTLRLPTASRPAVPA